MSKVEDGASPTGVVWPGTLRFGIRPRAKIISRIFIIVYAAILLLIDVAVVVGPDLNLAARIALFITSTVVGSALIGWCERRMVRASVTANPSGLYIYNGLGTHVVTWPEVKGFEDSSRPFLMAVKRAHGRPIPMAGITPELFGNRGPQRDSMQELEAYWRRMVQDTEAR
jgi:hypothetical protein